MKKFEYDTFDVIKPKGFFGQTVDVKKFNQLLNEKGQNGWELVGVTSFNVGYGQTGRLICTFKREVVC